MKARKQRPVRDPAVPGPASWHRLTPETAATRLDSDVARGLTAAQVAARRARYGANVIEGSVGRSPWRLFLAQFASTLVIVLIIAAAVAAAVGDVKDTVAILAIVLLNASLGFLQELRAERAIAALRRLAVPRVRVRRDGEALDLPASELVPGDLVLLEAGSAVPADGRIVEAASLRLQEAVLTGEAEPVEKEAAAIAGEAPLALGDQSNMAFMGTSVVYGRGQILITATGMATELGRVATLLQRVTPVVTPLQRRLNHLGRVLAAGALVVVAAIFGIGLLLGEDWRLMLMTSVSMAVAVIPEGLPAVVTMALAFGTQRMLRRRALIRRLPAVETLGSVTVICSDKTGTLTENRMTVAVLEALDRRLDLVGDERGQQGAEHAGAAPPDERGAAFMREEPSLALLLMGGALCSDAVLQPESDVTRELRGMGDPTESALVVAAARFGLLKGRLEAALPRVGELPFDSSRKRMTTLHRVVDQALWIDGGPTPPPGHLLVLSKGAVDSLLEVCSHVWDAGRPQAQLLDEAWRRRIARATEELAQRGMRVLGVACRFVAAAAAAEGGSAAPIERDLGFVGLVGMLDPPRAEVKEAVVTCRRAGIRPVMITGDHPLTARRIAADLGILDDGRVLTGAELQALSEPELDRLVDSTAVYARVAPEQKLRIVEALQRRGQVVAMTGDGVNDAPALRRADIGVAMGMTGTDVAKEAAAMVLLDDNFTTIVAAVEEGRAINDNIRRFLKFSLAGNMGKLTLVFVGPLLGLPLPLLPFQILWLNLITDGVLGLGIGLEPAERGTMLRPPQAPSEGVLAPGLAIEIAWQGLLLGVVNLAVAWWAFSTGQREWQTLAMTTVVLSQIFQAQAGRSASQSFFRLSPLSNPALLGVTGLLFLLQGAVVYVQPLHAIFGTVGLSPVQVAAALGAGLVVLLVVEGVKLLRRRAATRS